MLKKGQKKIRVAGSWADWVTWRACQAEPNNKQHVLELQGYRVGDLDIFCYRKEGIRDI